MFVALAMVTLPMQPASADITTCPIAQSVYRDLDRGEFELVFGAPLPNTGSSDATVSIHHLTHPNPEPLYRFNMTQSSGYGSIFLVRIDANETDADGTDWEAVNSLRVNFFDQDLRSANPLFLGDETEPPKYLFITGLGSHDYYHRRDYVTAPETSAMGEMMWRHERCQALPDNL